MGRRVRRYVVGVEALSSLLVLAAEDGTAYEIGNVFGRAVVIVAIVAVVWWLGQRFLGRRD
jgi:hypothetical protein